MDVIDWAIVVLLLASAVLLTASYVARRRSALRRRERHVDPGSEGGRREPASELAEVHDLLADGQKIKAIKAYRQATGADLLTAKNAVEDIQRGQPPQ